MVETVLLTLMIILVSAAALTCLIGAMVNTYDYMVFRVSIALCYLTVGCLVLSVALFGWNEVVSSL